MSLPTLSAGRSLGAASYQPSAAAIEPQVDFGCLAGCGVQAIPVFLQCGTNVSCYLQKAPGIAQCIIGCL